MARNQKPIQEVSQPDSGGNIILQEFKRSPLAYVTRAVVILLSFLFLWLAVQLAPLLRDLALIQQKVEAQEVQIIPRGEIEKQFELTNARLDRIENKLDRLVERPSGSTTNSTTTTKTELITKVPQISTFRHQVQACLRPFQHHHRQKEFLT